MGQEGLTAGMTAWEAPPAILEDVFRRLCANIDCRQAPRRIFRTGQGLAARDEVYWN